MSCFNYRAWFDAAAPYFYDGIKTSEKVLDSKNGFRIVRRSYRKVNKNGNPTGDTLRAYEIEYLDHSFRGGEEWELESTHPSYDMAKNYLGW